MSSGAVSAATVVSTEPDYAALEQIDWSFERAYTRGGTHAIHPYPAKFIPQIPRTLINHLHPGDDTAVLDPFCGSGTTLVEAALAGRMCIGIDLHPLACLISRVKTMCPPANLERQATQVASTARRLKDVSVPPIPRIDHWFRPPVQQALARLVGAINLIAEPDARDALLVALSSIIVRVSNQESDTRYAAIEKSVSLEEVFESFERSAGAIARALTDTWLPLLPHPRCAVVNSNVLDVVPSQLAAPVSLVVTSPPYPAAYEYWLYHKYRMYWLGMDPITVREQEIGARPHYFRSKPATIQDFENQMDHVFRLLGRVVVPGGHACFQVGDSKIRGEIVDNSALLRRSAARSGFVSKVTLRRQIPLDRKAFNPANSRIRREEILVFRLEAK
jgi:site-specific DNA-methyltransferase (cytosine-N4-specific)